jgi:hypothetical protein
MVKLILKDLPPGFKSVPADSSYQPDLSEWISNQSYVGRNLIAVVTRNVSTDQENGELYAGMIKAMLELHPYSIDGFWTGFSEDGFFMPDPRFKVNEKYGRPVDRLLTHWRRDYNCYQHTAHPIEGKQRPTKEQCTIDVMFIEPDPTCTKVVMAWHMFQMFPEEYAGLQSKRDLMRASPVFNFHGFRVHRRIKGTVCEFTLGYESYEDGDRVIDHAQRILNGIALEGMNPHARQEFVTAIAPDAGPEVQAG